MLTENNDLNTSLWHENYIFIKLHSSKLHSYVLQRPHWKKVKFELSFHLYFGPIVVHVTLSKNKCSWWQSGRNYFQVQNLSFFHAIIFFKSWWTLFLPTESNVLNNIYLQCFWCRDFRKIREFLYSILYFSLKNFL